MTEKITLSQYAENVGVDKSFLEKLEIKRVRFEGKWVIEIPYFDEEKKLTATRCCTSLSPKGRFIWKEGSKPVLYGLWKLKKAIKAGFVVLAKGQSGCHILWFNKFPALGLPAKTLWDEERDALHLAKIPTIYLAVRSDKENKLLSNLRKSSIRDKVKILDLGEYNNISDMYLADKDKFKEGFSQALDKAIPLPDKPIYTPKQLWKKGQAIAMKKQILPLFIKELTKIGVVGEKMITKLLYLCLTTRIFDQPISIAIKGESSGGKSFLTKSVLKFFPKEAYYEVTSMSPKVLVYTEDSFVHRFIWIYEAPGLSDNNFLYFLRTLLTEGKIKYPTVIGKKAVTIEKDGPTGLVSTTILKKLGDEQETRLISVPIDESPEQTKKIIEKLGAQSQKGGAESQKYIDLSGWQAFQAWLATANHEVIIPFAKAIAKLIDPRATRLRRDVTVILNLIKAHALIHQKTRERDPKGRIIARYIDYTVVHGLVSKLITRATEDNVPQTVRETVTAVKEILLKKKDSSGVSIRELADKLKLDKGPASKRVKTAADMGFLKNLEVKKGVPAKLVIIKSLRKDGAILPTLRDVKKYVKEMKEE